jgi:hypothetical protein
MPIFIALFAAATMAVATPSPVQQPVMPSVTVAVADTEPAWRAVRADTIGDLLFTTETLNGRVRFVAGGRTGKTAVTTSDFTPDSVRTWTTSAAELASSATPKMGEMRGLGLALTLNVTTTTTGETAFGFYVGDAVSDQQIALALTKDKVVQLTSDVNKALDTIGH